MISAFNDLVQANPLNAALIAVCCVGIVLIRQTRRQMATARRRPDRPHEER
jgi:hypothetical protein